VAPSYDYVCGVQWSPVHASLFSTITSGGVLTLWDLSKSTLEAQDSFNIFKDQPGIGGGEEGLAALNKLVWSVDGLSLYVGDTRGSIRQIAVKEACARSRPGDEGRAELALMARAKNSITGTLEMEVNGDVDTKPSSIFGVNNQSMDAVGDENVSDR
jgi:hypothetical protein